MTANTAMIALRGDGSHALVFHRTLAAGSKSFALATRLLPPVAADRAAILYTWCRRADDAVDLCAPADAPAAVQRLRAELAGVYADAPPADDALVAFRQVIRDVAIPIDYPAALLAGMARDAADTRYATVNDLLAYCYEVASTVGLMMSHVFGVRDDRALRHAAHLGIAMQLTNICRDVGEDWERGRLYLPDDVCAEAGASALRARLGEPVAALPRAAVARAVEHLLALADRFYRSGDRGIAALPWRAGVAVRAARTIYARIGVQLARRGYDPLAGRVFVPSWRKVALAAAAIGRQVAVAPLWLARRAVGQLPAPRVPTRVLRFPDDVLPL